MSDERYEKYYKKLDTHSKVGVHISEALNIYQLIQVFDWTVRSVETVLLALAIIRRGL